jgi:nitrile hydratase
MNGAHDVGGMHGLGAIAPEPDEPVYHARWESRVHAMTLASFGWGRWTLDAWRHQQEVTPGPVYLRISYYERWAIALAELLVKSGVATRQELGPSWPAIGDPATTTPAIADGPPPPTPGFAVGDKVRTRNINPTGHTRLPRYARGHVGVVTRHHGTHVLPDATAHPGLGDRRQPLYQVRFEAAELWGEQAGERAAVHLDLWEEYLVAA